MKQKLKCTKVNGSMYDLPGNEIKAMHDEILIANQNYDEDTRKMFELFKRYPKMILKNHPKSSVIKLNKTKIGVHKITITVNEIDFKFILDTGAEVSVFTNTTLQKAGIDWNKEDSINVGSFNNTKSSMEVAFVKKIYIGELEVKNLPVLVADSETFMLKIFGIKLFEFDGIIGWDILRHLDFELDYISSELRIVETEGLEMGSRIVNSDFPAIIVIDNKNRMRVFGLDTGARRSWLSPSFVENNNLEIVGTKKEKINGAHGKEIVNKSIVKDYKVILGDIYLEFENIGTGYTGFIKDYEFDGVFGCDILKSHYIRVINSIGVCRIVRKDN